MGKDTIDTNNKLSLLNSILKMNKKYGVFNVIIGIFVMFIFGLSIYGMTHFSEIIQQSINKQMSIRDDNETKKRIEDAEYHQLNDPKITNLLKTIIMETGAERAFVLECHDGTKSMSDLHFIYATMTYEETTNEDIMPVEDEYKDVYLSKYNIDNYVGKSGIWCGTTQELSKIDSKIAKRIEGSNGEYLGLIAMYKDGLPFGFVGLSYSDSTQAKNSSAIIKSLTQASQEISTLLDPYDHGNVIDE